MYKYFLKPLIKILVVYFIAALGIASDIKELTNFNLLDLLKTHSPQSYYFVIAGTLLVYLVLVIIEFIFNKPTQQSPETDRNSGQLIRTGDVKDSTFVQIRKDKED